MNFESNQYLTIETRNRAPRWSSPVFRSLGVRHMIRPASLLAVFLAASCVLASTGCKSSAIRAAHASVPRVTDQSRFSISAEKVSGIPVQELSGLAWDEDEQILYAVSDKGNVFHFRLKLAGTSIVASVPVFAGALAGGDDGRSRRGRLNAEGLAVLNAGNGILGDSELVVAVEGGEPRILRFSPTGAMLGDVPLPPPLNDLRSYRGTNKGLESATYHSKHGLMTAPESPLANTSEDLHTVYAGDRHWSFPAYPVKDSRLKALEMLSNGNLLVLERAFTSSAKPIVVSLRYVGLAACSSGSVCAVADIAVLSNAFDNFEGMTSIGNGRYLIVSDSKKQDLQETVLMLFTLQ